MNTSFNEFLEMPTEQVACLVKENGPEVCVFPINGTRRWFVLEHPEKTHESRAYIELFITRSLDILKLFFDHGIDTLLVPLFGPDLIERGNAYRETVMYTRFCLLQQHALEFYDEYDVRIRFYGDFRRHFAGTPYADAIDELDELVERTAQYHRRRVFFGICAHDATETIAETGIRFHQMHSRPPNRREIIEAYYGEYIKPVDIFIGFGRPTAFDMPLVAIGSEDLYFMVSPSLYLDARILRSILYDHLYTRRVDDMDYDDMTKDEWQKLASFYTVNRQRVLGMGRQYKRHFWYPSPQVEIPPYLEDGDDS